MPEELGGEARRVRDEELAVEAETIGTIEADLVAYHRELEARAAAAAAAGGSE